MVLLDSKLMTLTNLRNQFEEYQEILKFASNVTER